MYNMISSICRKHLPVLSSFMTYHRVCNQIDTTGATNGAGTTYPCRAPEFTLIVMGFVLLDLQNYAYVLQIVVCPFPFAHRVLSFFDLRILTIHLVYSNSSRNHFKLKYCVHSIDIPHYIFLPVQNQDFDFHRYILCFLCAIFLR